jgi:hypothetical protein
MAPDSAPAGPQQQSLPSPGSGATELCCHIALDELPTETVPVPWWRSAMAELSLPAGLLLLLLMLPPVSAALPDG